MFQRKCLQNIPAILKRAFGRHVSSDQLFVLCTLDEVVRNGTMLFVYGNTKPSPLHKHIFVE